MSYLVLKAFHLIFVVTWFAGLFYIVRLFIYSAEANDNNDETEKAILLKQFAIMQKRLWYGITWPSAIITLVFGAALLSKYEHIPAWLYLKLGLLVLLYLYHFSCQIIYSQQKKSVFKYTPYQLRLWNEMATLFLFAIVFLVMLKSLINFWTILIGIICLAILLLVSVKVYAKRRKLKT